MYNKFRKATGIIQVIAGLFAAVVLIQNILRGGETRMIVISAVIMISGLYLGYENVTQKN